MLYLFFKSSRGQAELDIPVVQQCSGNPFIMNTNESKFCFMSSCSKLGEDNEAQGGLHQLYFLS